MKVVQAAASAAEQGSRLRVVANGTATDYWTDHWNRALSRSSPSTVCAVLPEAVLRGPPIRMVDGVRGARLISTFKRRESRAAAQMLGQSVGAAGAEDTTATARQPPGHSHRFSRTDHRRNGLTVALQLPTVGRDPRTGSPAGIGRLLTGVCIGLLAATKQADRTASPSSTWHPDDRAALWL